MSNENENSEVSLKELILLVKSYIFELFKKWWLIIIICGLSCALFFVNESLKTTSYSSKLTFMMNDDNNAAMGGMSSLIGSVVGFGGGGDKNLDKMIKIIKSRTSIKEALFLKYTINGKEDFFANHILQLEDVEIFTDDSETELFFFKDRNFGKTDRLENKALLKIYKFLIGGEEPGILKISYDENSGIVNIESTFYSEELAVEFPIALFDVVEDNFVEKTIAKNQNTFEIIESKHDSIASLISSKEYQLAAEVDSGRNLLLSTSKLQRLKLEKDLRILYGQYGEVIKIKEQSEFSLLSITPVIQPIDLPIYPIKSNDMGIVKLFILSIVLGLFFSIAIILGLKIYNDAMSQES